MEDLEGSSRVPSSFAGKRSKSLACGKVLCTWVTPLVPQCEVRQGKGSAMTEPYTRFSPIPLEFVAASPDSRNPVANSCLSHSIRRLSVLSFLDAQRLADDRGVAPEIRTWTGLGSLARRKATNFRKQILWSWRLSLKVHECACHQPTQISIYSSACTYDICDR